MSHPKVILITGAARRIGASIARLLHAHGMNIIIHYRRSEAAALSLCAKLNQRRPDSAIAVYGDLASQQDLPQIIETAVQAWGYLDVLINNASAFFATPVDQTNEAHWDELVNTNLKAPFFLAQAATPWLKQRRGSIINIVDIHAEKPLKNYPVYSVSKAGLLGLTLALAKELAPEIRVNGISPGTVDWPENQNALPADLKAEILSRIALNHAGQATDVAKAALFFVEAADYITGQILAVDGGRLLNC